MNVIKCSKCVDGATELKPDSRGIIPWCVGCEELNANPQILKLVSQEIVNAVELTNLTHEDLPV